MNAADRREQARRLSESYWKASRWEKTTDIECVLRGRRV